MDNQINDRVKDIMDYVQMSPVNFANIIGINRSNLAHIFSGRNQPSFAMLEKILKAFPEIRTEWLITGIGSMVKSEQEIAETQKFQKENRVVSANTPLQTEFSFDDVNNIEERISQDNELTPETDEIDDGNDIEEDIADVPEKTAEIRSALPSSENVTNRPSEAGFEPILNRNASKSVRQTGRNSKNYPDTRRILPENDRSRKKVKKIVFFYLDNSFEEFYPE